MYTRLTALITHPTPRGIGYLGPGVVVETDAAGEEVWLRTQWLVVACYRATTVTRHPAVAPADRDLKHSTVDDVNTLSGRLPAATAPSQYTVLKGVF